MTAQEAPSTGVNARVRAALIAAIVILVVLFIGLIVVFYGLIKPDGGADPGDLGLDEMAWVRSLYGFGPTADEQLMGPSSVAIAPNGDIFVTDPTRSRIMVFRSDGSFKRLLHTGAGGTAEGQFIRPEAVSVGDDGSVYIADSWANKIIVFNDQGEYLREWPVEQMARGVEVEGDKVYVLDAGKVLVFDKLGKKLKSFGTRGPGLGQIDAYLGIAVKDGLIYVADSYNARLQCFKEDGTVVWAVPTGTASRKGPSETRELTGSDSSASDAVPNHRWNLPQDLVFDGAGRLVVVDAFRFEMAVVDPKTGKVQATHGEYGAYDGQFYYPTSIDYDAGRDWFAVADTNNNRVQIVRIPGSGASAVSGLWRALSSPFVYLAVPILLLVVCALLAWRLARSMAKRRRAQDQAESAAQLME